MCKLQGKNSTNSDKDLSKSQQTIKLQMNCWCFRSILIKFFFIYLHTKSNWVLNKGGYEWREKRKQQHSRLGLKLKIHWIAHIFNAQSKKNHILHSHLYSWHFISAIKCDTNMQIKTDWKVNWITLFTERWKCYLLHETMKKRPFSHRMNAM